MIYIVKKIIVKNISLTFYRTSSSFLNNVSAGLFGGVFVTSTIAERVTGLLYCMGCFLAANILDWLSKNKY